MRLSKFLLYILFPTAVAAFFMMFPLEVAPLSLLETGTWIIGGEPTVLPISVDDCWDIVTDDGSWEFWFPEVTNIRSDVEIPEGFLFRRLITFDVCKTNLLLCAGLLGSVEIDEYFDVWDQDDDERRASFYFAESSRPTFLFYTQSREEIRCDAINSTASEFRFKAASEPGLLTGLAGFIVKPSLEKIFEELVPMRLLASIEDGTLPRSVERV